MKLFQFTVWVLSMWAAFSVQPDGIDFLASFVFAQSGGKSFTAGEARIVSVVDGREVARVSQTVQPGRWRSARMASCSPPRATTTRRGWP